jgi:hypothetical protein
MSMPQWATLTAILLVLSLGLDVGIYFANRWVNSCVEDTWPWD